MGTRGPNSLRSIPCMSPAPRPTLFPYTTLFRSRAAEGAMGGGKHFKIRPPDKEDAIGHGESTARGEATATVAVYRGQRPMPEVRIDGNQRAEFSASQPVQESRTSAGSFLRVWPA